VKAAILISRTTEYKLFAPIVEAALARGWEVQCWHNYGEARTGAKGYQFPSVDAVPVFRNGRPLVRSFQGPSELRTWLAAQEADAVIATGSPQAAGVPAPLPSCTAWVGLQYLFDAFIRGGPDEILACDRVALYSRWWLDWAADYFASAGLVSDRAGFVDAAVARSEFVGLPEMDAAAAVDPEEVRRRWGIPEGQPVVVLFPYPQGVGRAAFWPRQIFAEPSRVKQLARIAAYRRFEYLPHVWHGWNDRNVLKALRQFCDRNGAYLLIKSRLKTPVPEYAKAIADKWVYDDSYYPATVLEALRIANLSVSFYSSAVFESAWLGVPHLCLTYSLSDYVDGDPGFFPRFYTDEEGGPFQFRGVSTAWGTPEALRRLPATALADFAMDDAARRRYVEKFLTSAAGDSGARTIDVIERAAQRPASGVLTPS
jgi:hypothetical protein